MYLNFDSKKITKKPIDEITKYIVPPISKKHFFNNVEVKHFIDYYSGQSFYNYIYNNTTIGVLGMNGFVSPKNKEQAYYYYIGQEIGQLVL